MSWLGDLFGRLFGRRPKPPAPPVPPLPPATRKINLSIYAPWPFRADLVPDSHPIRIAGEYPFPDEAPWRTTFVVPHEITEGCWVDVIKADDAKVFQRVRLGFDQAIWDETKGLPPGDTEARSVTVEEEIPPMEALMVLPGDLFFRRASGQAYTSIGCSDFKLWQRFIEEGEYAITPILEERRSVGFVEHRVFGMYQGGLGTFDPRPHIRTLGQFARVLLKFGRRMEFTVFADTSVVMPNLAEQFPWLRQVEDQLTGMPNVTIEGVNEADHYFGGVWTNRAEGIAQFTALRGLLFSHGSLIQEGAGGTLQPVGQYGTYHPARSADWPRKVGHNAMEDVADKYHIPAKSNELKRPDEDGFQVNNFWEAGLNLALLCAGGTFHSNAGKASQLFSGQERPCAEAFVSGMRAVPLEFQRGHYTRGGLSDSPIKWEDNFGSRAHAKLLGNRACVVVTQRTGDFKLEAVNGWAVVEDHGALILLAR